MTKKICLVKLIFTVIVLTSALWGQASAAVLDPMDPNLVLWLRASDLADTYDVGDEVEAWNDASSYGTVFDANSNFDEAPTFILAAIPGNPNPVPAVRFAVTCSSVEVGCADRLWQANNLGADDPLDLGAGDPMTLIVVYNNFQAGGYHVISPVMTVVAKRGAGSSVWELYNHHQGLFSTLTYVTYDAITAYGAGAPNVLGYSWTFSAMTISDSDSLNFYQDPAEDSVVDFQRTSNSPLQIAGRNITTPEPAGIAGHSQPCCGRGEAFDGIIAEIIIYKKVLDDQEMADISDYLTTKFLAPCEQTLPSIENVLNPDDPNLRLWLKADDLSATHDHGDEVWSWVDNSSYTTQMAPRSTKEVPHYEEVILRNGTIPAVRFDIEGDCVDSNNVILPTRDRLYQTNNLAPSFDPLDIGDGSSFTAFLVWQAFDVGTPPGGQTVFGKRGPNSSVYQLGINYSSSKLNYVTYDAQTEYINNRGTSPDVWHVTEMNVVELETYDGVVFYDDNSELRTAKMESTGSKTILDRNASTPEPFGIAAHSQVTPDGGRIGECESFGGYLAELIIFAKPLSCEEKEAIEEYLDLKYFPLACGDPGMVYLDSDINKDCYVNLEDFVKLGIEWLLCNDPAKPEECDG